MSSNGLGVMIKMLGGNEESHAAFRSCVGKKIATLSCADSELNFTFDDGTKLRLFDDGQSCCESRYMTCDDDLAPFVGSTLVDAEVRDATPERGDVAYEHDYHEVQFLIVTTSVGSFTVASHNEHNGYYGGFYIVATAE